jgi:hypothetical protein
MARESRTSNAANARGRADGVTIAPAPGSRKTFVALAAAALLAGVAIAILVLSLRGAPAPPAEPEIDLAQAVPSAATPEPAPVAPKPRARALPTRVPGAAPPPPPDEAPAEPAPGAEAPEQEPAADAPYVPSGIGLFPPPGTDPLKIGIVVPEDFELPEGYVRHYQVTDDGQPLPPILMFHPDYDWVDETGQHVDVSQDRVVPPELAPEGLPIEYLEPPPEPSEP